MSAEGPSLPPNNDQGASLFARAYRRCATWFTKYRAPAAPHATRSLHSESTENETIASPSSVTSAFNPTSPGGDLLSPLEIPVGTAGGSDLNPGPWASYAMKLPVVAMREPLQRSTTIYTGKRLDERIGSRAANVESILIQIVGEVSQQ
ncbi:hypothetical protein N7534_004714 [Penicillium rubens]|nr:hypothetical protein N7534_004714 [Penicillium rubens]